MVMREAAIDQGQLAELARPLVVGRSFGLTDVQTRSLDRGASDLEQPALEIEKSDELRQFISRRASHRPLGLHSVFSNDGRSVARIAFGLIDSRFDRSTIMRLDNDLSDPAARIGGVHFLIQGHANSIAERHDLGRLKVGLEFRQAGLSVDGDHGQHRAH